MVFMKKTCGCGSLLEAALPRVIVLATAVACLVLAGCCKEEPAVDSSSPESYMRDPVFRGKLAAERKEHMRLTQDRHAIVEKMKAMIDAKKAELKTDDLKAIHAALVKDPAWQELHAQCTNANAKVQAQRQRALNTVRERLAPKKPVSK